MTVEDGIFLLRNQALYQCQKALWIAGAGDSFSAFHQGSRST